MCSSFSLCINLALLTLFLFVSAEATNHHNLLQNSNFGVHNTQAQRFIRGLNLSTRFDANIVDDDPLDNASEIVEKAFRFPLLRPNNVTNLGHHAGYIRLPNTKGLARMFYYLFEARQNKAKAPVVVWLTGGPGCSGSIALFYENGPFKLTKNLSLVCNQYGWDQVANILFVDQPLGTGFSYSTKETDIPTTSEKAAVHFYDFLQAFFGNHPEYVKNDFYITGESYAGHYIPAFAARVQHGNKNKQGLHINLKGMAIGNGWTNSEVQTATYPDYAIKMNLINQSQYNYLKNSLVSSCLWEVENACEFPRIYDITLCVYITPLQYYDIHKKCKKSNLCYDYSRMEHFLNQKSVKKALGVDVRIEFASCSGAVGDAMLGDGMRNLAVYIPDLLEDGIKLLIYAGEYDLICNWLGNSQWLHEMKWSGQKDFNAIAYVPFMVGRVEAGLQKNHGNLTFLKVHKAGHMVPMDQPKAALEMLARWMQGHSPL
ncbi:serine carboxypeptidase-like 48 [Phtheirospermum japonicum]|uniref:Carboxypeptidase n=1 Tax=Phtheirospermum japonicum TaxID=374723 RepID=A0A830CRI6_9LAMI|nr:serine carboxypeptidase-like 48 [Phtheirospermum japonicum]